MTEHHAPLIWRFVDQEGEGIYRHASGGDDPRDVFNAVPYSHAYEYTTERPTPISDSYELFISWRRGQDLSGFGTLAQAKHWFNHRADMSRLDKIGVHLRAYDASEADNVVIGNFQAIFQPRDVTHYAEFKASDLYHMPAHALAESAKAQLEERHHATH